LIFATGVSPIVAAHSTFHYIFLRDNATGFLKIPITRVPKKLPSDIATPFIIFSPGRCGSTLLSKIIGSMNILSISEPDIYSGAAQFSAKHFSDKEKIKDILRLLCFASYNLIRPLNLEKNKKIILKMRSHVNQFPNLIVSSFPKKPRTIFLIRNFQDWCESRLKAFSNTLESNVISYTISLHSLKWLQKNTDCLLVHYEDLALNPRSVINEICSFMDEKYPDDVIINSVINTDSQSGTHLSKNNIEKKNTTIDKVSIGAIWAERKPKSLLDELNLPNL
jgi:hypothetical protein